MPCCASHLHICIAAQTCSTSHSSLHRGMSACMPLLLLLCLVLSQGTLYCMSTATCMLSVHGCKDCPAVMRSLVSIWKPCHSSCHRNWHRLLLLLQIKVLELPALVIDSQNKTIMVLQRSTNQQGCLEPEHGTERGHAQQLIPAAHGGYAARIKDQRVQKELEDCDEKTPGHMPALDPGSI